MLKKPDFLILRIQFVQRRTNSFCADMVINLQDHLLIGMAQELHARFQIDSFLDQPDGVAVP